MKNKHFLPFMVALAGCHTTAPQVRAEYSADAERGCAMFVRDSVGQALEASPGQPLEQEVGAMDTELRRHIFEACKMHHEVTGEYPGME